MRNEKKLYSTTVGYYSHGEGARYITPVATGARFLQLVELHESQHEYLALANSTDALGRLFGAVLEAGSDTLRRQHKEGIRQLLSVIHEHTVDVHETLATYVSFLAFKLFNPTHTREARGDLPPFYRNVLETAEAAFGAIDDPKVDVHDGLLALYSAIAAMNVIYPIDVVRFDALSECSELVRKHSPRTRFKTILSRVRPRWQSGGIFSRISIFADLPADAQTEQLHAAADQRIRAACPDIPFVAFREHPTMMREWMAGLAADASKQKYAFLANAKVEAHPEDTAIRRMTANISLPGLPTEFPLDLSLVKLNYTPCSLDEFTRVANTCSVKDHWLFCHVITEPGEEGSVACFCFDVRIDRGPCSGPFVVRCSLQELLASLAMIPRGTVILKIDEREEINYAIELARTGSPVFLLAHDARAWNLVRLIRRAADTQKVTLGRMRIKGDEFSVLLATFERDRVCLVAPTTMQGTFLIGDELKDTRNMVFPQNENELKRSLPASWEAITCLTASCLGY